MASSDKPFIIPIFLPHAGCPHRCVFCNQSSITGVRSKLSPKDINDQIEEFLKFKKDRRPIVQIAFFGGNFLGMPPDEIELLLAFATEYVDSGRVNGIRFSTRPDTIDAKRLDLIKPFPVTTIEIGVQSMDDRVLLATKRGHTASDAEKAVQRLKPSDYEIGLQLMVGLPCDDPERLRASARRAAQLKPDFIRIYPTVVLADSHLAKWYQNGRYKPLSLEEAVIEVKDIYRIFKNENIRVIRMGLQATEDLEKDSIILDGPYHAAFGHLVYSAIFLDMAVDQIESKALNTDTISIQVNPKNDSKLRGLRNSNIEILKKKFGFESVAVRTDERIAEDQLRVIALS